MILVVDDARAERARFQEFLTGLDYSVLLAESGTRALETALRYPGAFGALAAQSPAFIPAIEREIERLLSDFDASGFRVYIDWCDVEEESLADFTTIAAPAQRVAERFRSAGADVATLEQPGGHGWQTWTLQTEAILARFLPVSP